MMVVDNLPDYKVLRGKLRNGNEYLQRFIEELTVNVTEMFRDPHFYLALRKEILPLLATRPFVRIWHAGCSTGKRCIQWLSC